MNILVFFIFATVGTVTSSSQFHNSFVVEVLKKLPNKNTVVSSAALQFGLCKLASIIDGTAKEQIMKALGYTTDKQINDCYTSTQRIIMILETADLLFINKLYVNYTLDLNEKLINGSKPNFGIEFQKVGFEYPRAAANFINKEVGIESKKIAGTSFRRIRDVVAPNDIHNDTSMLFVLAAHMKPSWPFHFDIKKTKIVKFYRNTNQIFNVPMMTYQGSSLYHESHSCKYFLFNMGGWGMRMAFVMPSAMKGISGLLTEMKDEPDLFTNIRKNMEWKEVNLMFPKFKIKNNLNLISAFNKTGVTEILMKNTTSLKKMLNSNTSQLMYISGVRQNIFLDVDEFGAHRTLERDSPESSKRNDDQMMMNVVLDKPFYFSINLEISVVKGGKNDAPFYELFSGAYYGPEN